MKKKKPEITINPKGPQGNIFFITILAMKAMTVSGASQETKQEFWRNLKECHSYREAVDMIQLYVTIKWEGGAPM